MGMTAINFTPFLCLEDKNGLTGLEKFNPWSPGGSFVVQKMAITSPIPVF